MKKQLNEVQKLQKTAGILKENILAEESESFSSNMTLEDLVNLSKEGKLSPDDIRNITSQLVGARKKFFINKRSPEDRKASAAKGKDTRTKNKADREKYGEKVRMQYDAEEAAYEKRKASGLLPIETNDYTTDVDTEYYNFVEKGEWSNSYELKRQYINKKMPKDVLDKYYE